MILLCKYIKYTNGRMYIYMVQKFSPAPYQSPRLSPVRLDGWTNAPRRVWPLYDEYLEDDW